MTDKSPILEFLERPFKDLANEALYTWFWGTKEALEQLGVIAPIDPNQETATSEE